MTKDDRARQLIETEIRKVWHDIVRSVSITPRIDFLDEAALDVLVGLKSIQDVPPSRVRGDMLVRLDSALLESGDDRTTHIAFSAPDELIEFEADDFGEAQSLEH